MEPAAVHPTPVDTLAGIFAGVMLTLIAVTGLIWRLASWHAHLDSRLDDLDGRVAHLERIAGIGQSGKHRRQQQRYRR